MGPKVAPKTSPLYQLCKIWENVNNITLKVKNPEGSKYKWADYYPNIHQKEKIAAFLKTNEAMSYADLLAILDLKKENVYANKQIKNGLQGNITYAEIEKIIGVSVLTTFDINTEMTNKEVYLLDKKTGEILETKDGIVVQASIVNEPLYKLWHTIYSIKDMDECEHVLVNNFALENDIAKKLCKLDFNKQAFGNKSNKAMRKILPYLMMGYDYSQACSFAGYNHSNSLTNDENMQRILQDKLDLLPKNSLRQPIVEKILNQMINVVNAIIEVHGKPAEIRVELARELKQSKDERESADTSNRYNDIQNKEIEKRLKEHGLPNTKKYVQKYKYIFPVKDKKYKEQQTVNQCIYCGNSFSLADAITGDDFDVDHIIPKSLLFDDSQTNKVLVHRSCNKNKTNSTAYDYIASMGEVTLNDYILRVDDWFKKGILSYSKMMRLKVSYIEYTERKKVKKETEPDKKLWESFLDRQLRESQYIAKKAKEILMQVCHQVHATEGGVTAKLRDLWGWDDVLMNLQLSKYRDLGQTEWKEWTSNHGKNTHKKEVISNWSKRDDHRHHAIDALVIACTKQGFIQRINTLNADDTKDAMNKEIALAKVQSGEAFDKNKLMEQSVDAIAYSMRKSQLDNYLILQRPQVFTTHYLESEANKILVSFKAGKKVATKGLRKINVNGKKQIVQNNLLVPRGELHEQSIYGSIKVVDKQKPLKFLFENPSTIINKDFKALIELRLTKNSNDVKAALKDIKKNPIYINEEDKIELEAADCYKNESVFKYALSTIKTKDLPYIVDAKVKQIITQRLEAFNGNEKEAFKNTLWFNEEKQIPILTVRLFTKLTALEVVKKDEHGNPIGYAVPGNNHHVAIYKNTDGIYLQHTCTFWHALERKKNNLPVIITDTKALWTIIENRTIAQTVLDKLPMDNLSLVHSMQQNEMYILGMDAAAMQDAIANNDKASISKNLYLVWSVSENNFWFRHHLETKNSDLKKTEGAKESKRYYLFKSVGAFLKENPIKIRINPLGEISKVGE